jgi:hypothetical protein
MNFVNIGIRKAIILLKALMKLHLHVYCKTHILKAKNALVKSVYYIIKQTICNISTSLSFTYHNKFIWLGLSHPFSSLLSLPHTLSSCFDQNIWFQFCGFLFSTSPAFPAFIHYIS